MKPLVRRLLLFAAMVAAGLALVSVFSEDMGRPLGPALGRADDGQEEAVALLDPDAQGVTRMILGEVDFDVSRPVEIAPGQREDRPAYRVHILGGRPGPEGTFLVDSPTITLLDPPTGADRGEVSAEHGRFQTDQESRGPVDPRSLKAEAFTLSGQVRGRFPLEDGREARLEAGELSVAGPVVTAPGRVVLIRDDLRLEGEDMRWDRTGDRLTFARDAHLKLAPAAGRAGATVTAAGGLTWNPGAGQAELLGPVEGETTDGDRLAGDTLTLSDENRALLLEGHARLERRRDGGLWTVTAERVTVSEDEQGRLELARAEGGVHLVESGPDGSLGEMEADELTAVGQRLSVPGPVVWRRGDWSLQGTDLTWDGASGNLVYSAGARLEALSGSSQGTWLEAPGGAAFTVPADGAGLFGGVRGRLLGPVTGELSDGTRLSAQALVVDGAAGRLELEDDARLVRPTEGGDEQALQADRIGLALDDESRLTGADAHGDVRLAVAAGEGQPVRLTTDRLDVQGTTLTVPQDFVVSGGGLRLEGLGLTADRERGELRVGAQATLTLTDDEHGGPIEVEADRGLVWWLPTEPGRPASQGHGELLGPVRGRTPAGHTLLASVVLVDGASRDLTLVGDARLGQAPDGELRSERLRVHLESGHLAASTDERLTFHRGTLSGEGAGLQLDEASGQLRLERDVRLHLEGGQRGELASEGPFTWAAPPGSADPVAEGHGHLEQGVVGTLTGVGHLVTDRLELDGPAGTLRLLGPSRLEQVDTPPLARLAANGSITVTRGADGSPVRLAARGAVTGTGGTDDVSWLLEAEELLADRRAGTVRLPGAARVERRQGGRRVALVTPAGGGLELAADAEGRLVTVDAHGRVRLESADVTAEADTLAWTLAEDHVVLNGDCRFHAIGASMRAPRVEVWPEAVRWFVPNSVVVLDEPASNP